jgi:ribosome maturation factor RimP
MLRQYHRNIGRTCKVKYSADGKKSVLEGKLDSVSEKSITIVRSGKPVEVPFADISETYIIPQIK